MILFFFDIHTNPSLHFILWILFLEQCNLESNIGENMEVLHPKVLVERLVRQRQFFEKPKNANNVVVLADEVQVLVPLAVLVEHLVVVVDLAEEEEEGVVALLRHRLEEEDSVAEEVAHRVVVVEDLEEDRVLLVGFLGLGVFHLPGTVLQVSMGRQGKRWDD